MCMQTHPFLCALTDGDESAEDGCVGMRACVGLWSQCLCLCKRMQTVCRQALCMTFHYYGRVHRH